jgi:cobalamin biosynthesis Mg chelatase CobN
MIYLQKWLPTRARVGAAACVLAAAAAACVLAGLAIASTVGAISAQAAGTATFPVPASERAHPAVGDTTTGRTSTPAGASAPSTVLPSTAAKSLPTTTAASQPITTFKSTSTAPARAHARAKPSSKLSTAAIVVAIVAALLALGCAAWGLARRRAFEPHWLLSLRHAMAEAGFRTSATWAEFADWARLGR